MAVLVNNVYKKVLALANKEQRGYITPKEFNLFASHAQIDIFEQYFYDLEQAQRSIGNELDHGDVIAGLEEKISMFAEYDFPLSLTGSGTVEPSSDIANLYRLSSINVNYNTEVKIRTADRIQMNEIQKYQNSPLAAPTKSNPVYAKYSTPGAPMVLQILPPPANQDTVFCDFIRRPTDPNWTYVVSNDGNALFMPRIGGGGNFELHSSEESNLVIKILQLAGVAIKDFNLAQAASQEEIKKIQQEKQ